MHLVAMHKAVRDGQPSIVVVDPISNLITAGSLNEAKSMLTRLIDFLKNSGITAFFTDLVRTGSAVETTNEEISSLIDTWISLRDMEVQGERNRGLLVIKSRGMSHSNQIREFLLTHKGIDLLDVYLGPAGVLTGTARAAQEAREKAEELVLEQVQKKKRREFDLKRRALEGRIAELRAEFERETQEEEAIRKQEQARIQLVHSDRAAMARLRRADATP
jgi:circadian clock protein KaiC